MLRFKYWIISILIAAGIITAAFAVTNNITGVAPTTNTDGSALTNLASIRIYKAVLTGTNPDCTAAGTVYSVFQTVPYTTAGGSFSVADTLATTTGRYCYQATAINTSGTESARTSPV